MPETGRPTLSAMALAFLVLGAQAFGGQAMTIALLRRDLVERRGWLRGVPERPAGLTATVVGLIGATALKLGQKTIRGWDGCLIALLAFALSIRFHLNPALLMVLAGLWGIARGAVRRKRG